MLKFVNTTKKFIGGEVITTALNNINLEIQAGEYVAVMGPSGCGKTTLLSIIGMLDTPDGGEYWFDGKNVAGYREDQLNELRRGRIGFIFQSFNLIEELSVEENVELALEYTSASAEERRERVAADAREVRRRASREASSVAALGRSAATRGRGARAGHAPGGSAGRRTHGQPRLRAWRRGHGVAAADQRGRNDHRHGHAFAHACGAREAHRGAARWSHRMKRQDFRVAWRLMVREPGYSLVAVLGLAVGLAAFLLLSGFARYSWSYNAQVPDVEHVYLIKHRFNVEGGRRWWDKAPMMLREAALATPGVTDATGYLGWFPLNIPVDGQLHKLRSLTVLPGFAEMMGLQAVKGDLTEALTRPDAFAITESAALRLFGTTDVLGRAFLLNSVETKSVARIAAILRDPPANTTIPFESLNGLNLTLVPPMLSRRSAARVRWDGRDIC